MKHADDVKQFNWGNLSTYFPAGGVKPRGHRVGFFNGHSTEDGGAFGEFMNLNEHDFFAPLVHEFGALAALDGYTVDVYMRDKRGWAGWRNMKNELNRRHLVTPYTLHPMAHYNDGNGNNRGAFGMFWHTSIMGQKAAHIFGREIGQQLEIPHSGWDGKGGAPLKWGKRTNALVRLPYPPSIVLEHGFGDNPHDAAAMIENRWNLPETWLRALNIFADCLEG